MAAGIPACAKQREVSMKNAPKETDDAKEQYGVLPIR